MPNSLRKLFSGLFVALAALIISGVAQAEETTPQRTPEDPARAAVTKHLEMPVHTITPRTTFRFDFTRVSFNGETTLPTGMPEIPQATTAFAYPAHTGVNQGTATPARPDVDRAVVTTGDVLAGLTWPSPGIFAYNVTERTDTFLNTDTDRM